MQYLVEGARGPLPPSPEQAIAVLEGTVIPHFEYMIRLKAEGKILAGGIPVGDRAFICIIEAGSNEEADRIVRDMPAWGLLEWKVTPLQSVEARAEMERKAVHALKSGQR
jgi:muconolactone delta-isomerase